MTGGEAEFDGDGDGVDDLGVLGAEEVGADDEVGVAVDEDLGGGGGFADAVIRVPAAGVVVALVKVDAGLSGFVFEESDADEFGDGEHGGGDARVVGDGGRPFEHVGGGDLAFEHGDGGEREAGGVGGVAGGVDGGVGGALEVTGDGYAVGGVCDVGGVEVER